MGCYLIAYNTKTLYLLPTQCMQFPAIIRKTTINYFLNGRFLLTEMQRVYFAVGTENLNIIKINP